MLEVELRFFLVHDVERSFVSQQNMLQVVLCVLCL